MSTTTTNNSAPSNSATAKVRNNSEGPKETVPPKPAAIAARKDLEGQTEARPQAKACRFFAEGKCRRGADCKFEHGSATEALKTEGTSPTAAGPSAQGKRKEKVKLDVWLDDEETAKIRETYPEYFIVNGAKHHTSPHALDRAERTLITRLVAKSKQQTLEIQGRFRSTDAPTRDICRLQVSAEDQDGCCPCDVECVHAAKLADGGYRHVVTVDVPLEPNFIRDLLDSPGVQDVTSALHIHTAETSISGTQVATWVPKLGALSYADDGSVGSFSIACAGRAAWVENDHAWITLHQSVNGVRPETVDTRGTYAIVRFTRVAVTAVVPMAIPTIWPFTRKHTTSAYVAMQAVGRKPAELVRLTDELILLRDDEGWFATCGDTLRHAHELAEGRPVDSASHRKLVASIGRDRGSKDATRLASYVLDIEMHDAKMAQDSLDRPSSAEWFSWLPFAWVLGYTSKRALAARNIARSKASAPLTISAKYAQLLAWVTAVIATAVPWPYRECIAATTPQVTWPMWQPTLFGILSKGAVALRLPWLQVSHMLCTWEVEWWSLYLPHRFVLAIALMAMVPRLAYADDHCMLRESYINDRFGDHNYTGPLPVLFGLPGYVAHKPLKPLGVGCKLRVREARKWVDEETPPDMMFAIGIVFSGRIPSVALPCQQNLIVAVRNRQLAAMPAPEVAHFRQLAGAYIARLRCLDDTPAADFDEWNARFPPPRQRNHLRARQALWDQNVTDHDIIIRDGFSKVEKILRLKTEPYDPRCITGASDAFNVIFGPWFYAATKTLKQSYDGTADNVLFASGASSGELGEWFARASVTSGRAICGDDQLIITRGVFIEVDGSRHDAHMHEEFFNLKWAVYRKLLTIPPRVTKYARESARQTVARSRAYALMWTHMYRVRSGDPDTTGGNSVCTDFVASVVQALVEEGFDNGMSLAEIRVHVVAEVLRLGYEITITVTRDPTDVTFLSGAFTPVNGAMFWYPLPGRQLAKMGWSIRNVAPAIAWRDYAGVLNSYRDFSFVPFLRTYVDFVSQMIPAEYRMEPPTKRWQIGPGLTPPAPSHDTWDWFTRRYSLAQCDEEAFKTDLAHAASLPYMVESAHLRQMVEVDLA